MFVTCNRVLKDQVEKSFLSLAGNDPDAAGLPRFFNSNEWLLMLDKELCGEPFFGAEVECDTLGAECFNVTTCRRKHEMDWDKDGGLGEPVEGCAPTRCAA